MISFDEDGVIARDDFERLREALCATVQLAPEVHPLRLLYRLCDGAAALTSTAHETLQRLRSESASPADTVVMWAEAGQMMAVDASDVIQRAEAIQHEFHDDVVVFDESFDWILLLHHGGVGWLLVNLEQDRG